MNFYTEDYPDTKLGNSEIEEVARRAVRDFLLYPEYDLEFLKEYANTANEESLAKLDESIQATLNKFANSL